MLHTVADGKIIGFKQQVVGKYLIESMLCDLDIGSFIFNDHFRCQRGGVEYAVGS